MRPIGRLISALLGAGWMAFVVALPLLGVWLASSLIALAGGPRWLALAGGVLLFPVLPLWWERRADRAWKAKQARTKRMTPAKRHLTTLDRLVLRTLSLNLVFLAALLVGFPRVAFTALATCGDWFLGESTSPAANDARKVLSAAATGLEWLHEWANPNPYRTAGDETPIGDAVTPTKQQAPTGSAWSRWRALTDAEKLARADGGDPTSRRHEGDGDDPSSKLQEGDGDDPGSTLHEGDGDQDIELHVGDDSPKKPPPPTDAVWKVGETAWPWPDSVHPVVAGMTADQEQSIESVARTIAARTSDPFDRVKALHDWVVTRLTYDQASTQPGQRKPQDAQSVFLARTGVCEGYARLLVALGKVTGDRIVYVTGEVREPNGELAPVGHAWNAVELKGAWYLVDATWDDPVVDGESDTYRTDYLFIPPSLAAMDHLPDDTRFQLLEKPLSRVDFLRQAPGRPALAREGLALVEPQRGVVDVRGALTVRLENPRRVHVMLTVGAGDGPVKECGVSDAATVELTCPLPGAGRYVARLYTNKQRFGTFGSAADFQVNAR
ncbi:MAG: transglutaminase domain-containing protein [Myxococcota bacterium]